MANIGDTFAPGDTVPDSGFYECTNCRDKQKFSTDVKGNTFPPAHHTGSRWKLVEKRP